MAIGISPMDGTTNEMHMREDIALLDRIRSGEIFFANSEELGIIGNALGTVDWRTDEGEEL